MNDNGKYWSKWFYQLMSFKSNKLERNRELIMHAMFKVDLQRNLSPKTYHNSTNLAIACGLIVFSYVLPRSDIMKLLQLARMSRVIIMINVYAAGCHFTIMLREEVINMNRVIIQNDE